MNKGHGLLHDEQGSRSAMRHLLFGVNVPVVVSMTIAEGFGRSFQPTVWTFWGGFTSMLAVGCFGPRMAQYLAPIAEKLGSAIGQAKRDARLPSRLDDERGSDQ